MAGIFRRIFGLVDYFLRRRRIEGDIDEELRSSLDTLVDRFVARGMSPADARRAAQLEFEGLEQVKENVRDGLAGSGVTAFFQDLRLACRGLLKQKSFAAAAWITLALGIGVNTAVFSVFYAVLMQPLPYERPDELVLIWTNLRSRGSARISASGIMFGEIERRQRSMSAVAGVWVTPPRTLPGDPPQQVKAAFVTTNFFDVLGVRAASGRTFNADDGGGPVLMLSHGLWRRRFDADTAIVGTPLPGAGGSTLVGVLPADFQLHFAPEANVPGDVDVFQTWGPGFQDNVNTIIRVVARLNPGVTIAEAQRDFDRVASEIREYAPVLERDDLRLVVTGMQQDAFRDVRPALLALFAGGAFVLLICCVNVSSLLLSRASLRRNEIALRLALGASRRRILLQMLAEGAVLSAAGGVGGVGIGWAVFRGLLAIRPERLARLDEANLLWTALGCSAAAVLAATVVFAAAPALQSSHIHPIEALRARGIGWLTRLQRRAGHALVIGEIAIGFVLVTGAVLAAQTLFYMERARPGFEPQGLLAFQLPGLPGVELTQWEARFAALPGVEGAGAISHLPFDTTLPNWFGEYRVAQGPRAVSGSADHRAVTPGYLPAIGARLLEGRHFGPQDRMDARPVVIIDDILARSLWPGESALGKIIDAQHMVPQGTPFALVPSEVVGVVEHVHHHSLTRDTRAQIYSPFEQNTRGDFPQTFVLRTALPPLSLAAPVRSALRDAAPGLSMDKVQAMSGYVEREVAPAGFTAVLGAVFGILALVLVATGIFGVLSHQISRRMPEIGIRMAVGAARRDVLRMVLREGLWLAAAGATLGFAGAFAVAHWLGSLLYGVSPNDPFSYVPAFLLLPAAALLGCCRPAWLASTANPAETIRAE